MLLIFSHISPAEYGYSYVVPVGSSRYEARNGKRMGKNPFLVEDIRMIEYPGTGYFANLNKLIYI